MSISKIKNDIIRSVKEFENDPDDLGIYLQETPNLKNSTRPIENSFGAMQSCAVTGGIGYGAMVSQTTTGHIPVYAPGKGGNQFAHSTVPTIQPLSTPGTHQASVAHNFSQNASQLGLPSHAQIAQAKAAQTTKQHPVAARMPSHAPTHPSVAQRQMPSATTTTAPGMQVSSVVMGGQRIDSGLTTGPIAGPNLTGPIVGATAVRPNIAGQSSYIVVQRTQPFQGINGKSL